VRYIRERDEDIRREQMMEFRKQREDLVAARRLDRNGNASMEETGRIGVFRNFWIGGNR